MKKIFKWLTVTDITSEPMYQGEYRKKGKDVDQKIISKPAGERGPVERTQDEFGYHFHIMSMT